MCRGDGERGVVAYSNGLRARRFGDGGCVAVLTPSASEALAHRVIPYQYRIHILPTSVPAFLIPVLPVGARSKSVGETKLGSMFFELVLPPSRVCSCVQICSHLWYHRVGKEVRCTVVIVVIDVCECKNSGGGCIEQRRRFASFALLLACRLIENIIAHAFNATDSALYR